MSAPTRFYFIWYLLLAILADIYTRYLHTYTHGQGTTEVEPYQLAIAYLINCLYIQRPGRDRPNYTCNKAMAYVIVGSVSVRDLIYKNGPFLQIGWPAPAPSHLTIKAVYSVS